MTATQPATPAPDAPAAPAATPAPAAPESEVVVVEARLLREEYDTLRQASSDAGLSPNDFVRRAIVDEAALLRSVGSERGRSVQPRRRFSFR
jgi:hypothetical protein